MTVLAQVTHALDMMQHEDKYFSYASIVWDGLTPNCRDQLRQLLFQGPVWDGNIISKSDRDTLIKLGLATRCCFMGEQGYTAATYTAHSVWKAGKGQPFPKKPGSQP